jgi:hypothetical protein
LFWTGVGSPRRESWLFGPPWQVGSLQLILVPLLAVPQFTHYILDGFIWRRRGNPEFTLATARPNG